jgi:hypothetical protein
MKKKSQLWKIMILLTGLALCAPTQGSELPITVVNSSFELPGTGTKITNWSSIDGWSGSSSSGTGVEKNEYYSPVDGEWYAFHAGGESYTYQLTDHTITAGETYTLTVWARSINSAGNLAATTAEVRFYYGSTEITSVTANVNPIRLQGVPRTEANDDGGNVWIDQGYRHEFADIHMYQQVNADPLTGTWYACWDDYDDYHNLDAWAVGPVIVPGHKWVYGVNYDDEPPGVYSEIRFVEALSGGTPAYNWTNNYTTVLYHVGDEDPWVIDPHLYYDDATGRLWMSWGGGTCWVSEMDPSDGMLIDHPSNKEFDTHPGWYHTAVAYWSGDEWSSSWFEGPALYKHNGYWYYLACYGNLAVNYTIRGGRGTSPTGPFYDKDGIAMTEWDSSESEYGNTLILGADGGQANPGHPHIWEENGKFYMGYDYTDEYTGSGTDRFGIRRLYWVDDWPVVAYTPIEVTFSADDYPAAIGQKLRISVRNVGSASSDAAFDYVSLTYTTPPPPTPDIDNNGDVNFVDYSLFSAQFMGTESNDFNAADFTTDGNVDYNDLDIFADNWLRDYGLVGYWELDSDANDGSGYANDGTVYGAVWVDDSNRGWCLSLDGGNDYVRIPADASLNVGNITMAAWVKASNATPAKAMHVLNREMTKLGTYVLWLTSSTYKWAAQIRLDGSENSTIRIYSNDVATTDWTHIAATYDGSVFKMYINGILQTDTNAAAGSIDKDYSNSLTIGSHPDPKLYFAGLIDEAYIYDKALNQQQIQALAGI